MPEKPRLTIQDGGKSELLVSWAVAPVRSGGTWRTVDFRLKNQRIIADPSHWKQLMPPEAQDAVFNAFLSKYRSRSECEIKAAAIGVSDDGQIYIGINTEERGHSFARDCAEQNMIHAFRHSGATKPQSRLETVYVMGGSDTLPLICPCGNCTESLALKMEPDARIVVLPVNDGSALPVLSGPAAQTLLDLAPGEGWDTTIGHLRRYAEIPLKAEAKKWGQQGFAELERFISQPVEREWRSQEFIEQSAKRAGDNVREGRISNPELDVLAMRGMQDHEISRYMWFRMAKALRNRVHGDAAYQELAPGADRQAFIGEQIKQCVHAIIKLSDDTYHDAVTVQGSYDKSSPSAGTLATLLGQSNHGRVLEVWYKKFSPPHIQEGLMLTPDKESVERAIKRGPGVSAVQFHVLPFMRSDLGRDKVGKYILKANDIDLFPGGFRGSSMPGGRVSNCSAEARYPLPEGPESLKRGRGA